MNVIVLMVRLAFNPKTLTDNHSFIPESKSSKKLSDEEKAKLDKLEAGIKKKLANPTKDNIAIIKQLIVKPEIKKLFKDGGKDLKALISDVIR